MKVSELSGVALDYWVARCEGMSHEAAAFAVPAHDYSTEWAYGGPIIERERIALMPAAGDAGAWLGQLQYRTSLGQFGATPLIAAMRAYIEAKFGGEAPETEKKAA